MSAPSSAAADATPAAGALMALGGASQNDRAPDMFSFGMPRFDEGVAALAVSLPAGGAVAGEQRPLEGAAASPAAAPSAAAAGGRAPAAGRREFYLHPAVVRRNDTSAAAIDEWTVRW